MSVLDQQVINVAMGALGTLALFILNAVWARLTSIEKKIAELEVLVAGNYVKKSEHDATVKAIFDRLEKLHDLLLSRVS